MSVSQQAWKYLFCDILNDPGFRRRLTGLSNLGFMECDAKYGPKRCRWIDTKVKDRFPVRGTIYMYFTGDAGHYVSYRVQGKEVIVFDPSYPGGTFSGSIDTYWKAIHAKFKEYGFELVRDGSYLPNAQQTWEGDSFCQTWSLAYFTKLRKYLHVKSESQSMEMLTNIISDLVRSAAFRDIVITKWDEFLVGWQHQGLSLLEDENGNGYEGPILFLKSDEFLEYCERIDQSTLEALCN